MLLWNLLGCVLGVSGDVVIDEPIDRVEVRLSRGRLTIDAAPEGAPAIVSFERTGFGQSDSVPEVVDGVLRIPDPCRGSELCSANLTLDVPPEADVDARVDAGSLQMESMGGDLFADVGGRVVVRRHTGRWVDVVSSAGQWMDLGFDAAPEHVEASLASGPIVVTVPPGAYAMDLQASGSVTLAPEIEVDPDSPSSLLITAEDGSITVGAN